MYLVAEFRRKNADKKLASSKAKDTSKNAKRKEPPVPSEGRNKRQEVEVESDGDENNAD